MVASVFQGYLARGKLSLSLLVFFFFFLKKKKKNSYFAFGHNEVLHCLEETNRNSMLMTRRCRLCSGWNPEVLLRCKNTFWESNDVSE